MLLCEGEKSADAAAGLIGPPWAAIASMNGAKSPHRTDWSPLAGRDLVIWPDNDEPGAAYAREAAMLALKAGAASVRIVDLPDGLPEGWDLADPVPDGVELDHRGPDRRRRRSSTRTARSRARSGCSGARPAS